MDVRSPYHRRRPAAGPDFFLNVRLTLSTINANLHYSPFLEAFTMAMKAAGAEVNKSAELRELLKQNPQITAAEALAKLAERGIKADPSLFYFTKGKLKGRKGRRKKAR